MTGVSGVLGATLQARAAQDPDREWIFSARADCDLRDAGACLEHVGRVAPEAIVQLAAVSGGIGLSGAKPATMLRDNVLINLHVLEAARIHGIRKVVLALSSGMYPADAPQPLRETSVHDGPPHSSNWGYAYAKRLLEPAARAYRAEWQMDVVGLVPNALYGPLDRFDEESGTVIRALIRRFHGARSHDGPIAVWGDGTPRRELTYAPDMARAFLWGLDHYSGDAILNVGATEEHSIREIAELIATEWDIDRRRIVFDTSRPPGIARRRTDNSRFVAMSGFRYTAFRDGLRRTLAWYAEQAARGHPAPGAERRPTPGHTS